jgi:signal transduction histidine kinase
VVAVATSADRERDRDHRSERRVVWAVLAAGGLVLSFGGLALLLQRKELTLERDLALADLARERDERLKRLDRAATLGALAIGVGHEISTPLGVISGRAEQLLPRVKMDERATAAVQTIIDQTRRIDEVVRALMALARGDRGSVQQIDPARVVESAKNLVEHRFQEAKVQLSAGLPTDLPKIHGDALLLEQALVNLLLNACEACGTGGHVSVSARGAGGYLGFQVQDDGIGISAEIAARATEPFFTTKSTAGGSGLGLAIVNEIVANHGGRLVIQPRDPKGTAATMEIPIDRSTGERHG